jgi:hypothetical protein
MDLPQDVLHAEPRWGQCRSKNRTEREQPLRVRFLIDRHVINLLSSLALDEEQETPLQLPHWNINFFITVIVYHTWFDFTKSGSAGHAVAR